LYQKNTLNFPAELHAESGEQIAGNMLPVEFAKDLHSQVIPACVIVPEDFRNRRKPLVRVEEVPLLVNVSCKHTASNSIGKSAA